MDYNKENEDYRKKMGETVEAAAKSIETLVNGGGEEFRKLLIDRLGYMHRTLQQKLIGDIVIPLVRNMAKRVEDGNYDARNKYACEACAAMLNGLAEEFPYVADGSSSLPLI